MQYPGSWFSRKLPHSRHIMMDKLVSRLASCTEEMTALTAWLIVAAAMFGRHQDSCPKDTRTPAPKTAAAGWRKGCHDFCWKA